ncbi:MAG: hypothetical protein MZV70_39580 [Desulfobacterales bacterium]|nr:hypothetical protein [Desulfobacterales bacterium]
MESSELEDGRTPAGRGGAGRGRESAEERHYAAGAGHSTTGFAGLIHRASRPRTHNIAPRSPRAYSVSWRVMIS